jgi:hypothetical protein
MNTPDEMAMAMTMLAQFDRRADKEARQRRRRALTQGDGQEAKYWRAVHRLIVRLQSEEAVDKPHRKHA